MTPALALLVSATKLSSTYTAATSLGASGGDTIAIAWRFSSRRLAISMAPGPS